MNFHSTPLPIPRNEETHSLSDRINLATRSTHTQLNRLIIARLPTALPPHTSDPSLYAIGLLHIAPIYITFESLWQNFISTDIPTNLRSEQKNKSCDEDTLPKALSADRFSSPSVHQTKICDKKHFILSQLLLPGLLRSKRLRSDINVLSGKPMQEIDDEISHISHNAPALTSFIGHIKSSVLAKPHVLVAYAWVLYMALFSGGRYLRASLNKPGNDFWLRPQPQSLSSVQPHEDVTKPLSIKQEASLSDMTPHNPHHLKELMLESESGAPENATTQTLHQFFHFPGVEDGEDIKKEFKKRVAEMDILLSDREKDEIIEEAQHIFNFMVGIVGDLDGACQNNMEQEEEKSAEGSASMTVKSEGGVSVVGREWLSSANLALRSGGQTARRLLVFRAVSRMVNFGMETLWQCILSPLIGRGFNDQRV